MDLVCCLGLAVRSCVLARLSAFLHTADPAVQFFDVHLPGTPPLTFVCLVCGMLHDRATDFSHMEGLQGFASPSFSGLKALLCDYW